MRLDGSAVNVFTARFASEAFIRKMPVPLGRRYAARGIVICGGGPKHFPNAWVCIRMLRHVGCSLPIQLWHLGSEELPRQWKRLLDAWEVRCVDALEVRRKYPARI